jgi:hypothetical protein
MSMTDRPALVPLAALYSLFSIPEDSNETDRLRSKSAILLALGTLKLEDTGSAVTPAEAAELLPLWRTIATGSLQSDAETNAGLTQIEGAMSGPQLAAINAMELEGGDVQVWVQEQGIAMPAPPGGQGNSSGPGALENLSEGERAKMLK